MGTDGVSFFFIPYFICCWKGGQEDRKGGGLDWTYGVVDYSFDGDENPESRRHYENVEV